jgi:putative inorganic carbon (hco3(-)) transporter
MLKTAPNAIGCLGATRLGSDRVRQPSVSYLVDAAEDSGPSEAQSIPLAGVSLPTMIRRTIMSRPVAAVAFVPVSALMAMVVTEAMYRYSPGVGAAVLLGPAVLALVAWRPVLGIYASLLAISLDAFGTSVGTSTVTPAKGLLVLTAASVLPRLVLQSSTRRLHRVHLWFFGLLAVSLSGLVFAPDTHAVLVTTGNAFAYLLISIYVSRMRRVDVERLVVALVVSGAIVGAVTILNSGNQSSALTTSTAAGDAARAQFGLLNPNVIAFYLLLTVGPALAMIGQGSVAWQRLLPLVATPLIVVGLILTQSRSAIVGAFLAVLVLLGSSRFRRVAAVLAPVLLVVVAFNFGNIMQVPQLAAVSQRLAQISSATGVAQNPRVAIWRTTPRIIADHFVLGVGEDNFPVISPRYGLYAADLAPIDHAHDIFLTVAAELGLIGLAIFLGFLFALVRAAWRALTRTGSSRALILGVVASLTGSVFPSIGDYPLRTPEVLAALLIMVGLVLALERDAHEPNHAVSP